MTFHAADSAWFVLDISVRACAAAAAVALILRLLRMRTAAVLHAAWAAVLGAMLLMPVLLSIVPAIPIPVRITAGGILDAGSPPAEPASSVVTRPTLPSSGSTGSTSRSAAVPRSGDRPPAPAAAPRSWLPPAIFAVYGAGVVVLLTRLIYGWTLASAMVRRARRSGPIRAGAPAPLFESSDVTVPMTIGVIHPVIVFPLAWRTWDAETLEAIVAHEAAHVRRRDAAINFVACVNRAIFWFHPLAWWLERKLAVTAEHACDDAAARAIAAPDRYAEILVEMADIVRRSRGRLAWQGVGVGGAGLLDGRIDRLLHGEAFAGASRASKAAAAIGCLLALAAPIACRQQAAATPLREDAALTKRLAERETQTRQFEAARDMTQPQADALEQRIAANAADFDARRQLVTYYAASTKVAWDKKVPGLRRHALWLIEHHPEHDVRAPALSPQFDPEGFAAAKKLWESHLAKADATPFVVYRAAQFFAPHDKTYAEQLILRGAAMDPDSTALKARMPADVGAYQWPMQLASLYAAALRGSESVWGTYNDLRTHPDRVGTPYAAHVRQTLEATKDARLLAAVGAFLTRPMSPSKDPAIQQALAQTHALGVQYLERAVQLDPNLESAKASLVRLRLAGQATDADRLANRAIEAYTVAEDITEYARKDTAAGKQQRDEAKARAEEVLKLAAGHAQEPAYASAIMTAHHVLALAALRDGDRERAVQHMRESVKVPASERIQYAPSFSWSRPVHRLLKEGERERVVEFLEALARLTITERSRLLADAQAIREGRMPTSYQFTVAREGR